MESVLVANRGEIAVRLLRGVADLGLRAVGIASEDDVDALHTRIGSETCVLRGSGPSAYLDAEQILEVAIAAECDAIHAGYGFLSESSAFAQRCLDNGLHFIGPQPEHLSLFGDKARGRELARGCGVPVLRGTAGATTLDEAMEFFGALGPDRAVMVKALAGGGGRGIRMVRAAEHLPSAFERCQSEAGSSFGDSRVFVEEALVAAQHVEVQVVGDGTGDVIHLGERDCTVQRRNQKLIETAPSATISDATRLAVHDAAIRVASSIDYRSVGTFEFLVDVARQDGESFYFLEVNPRLQVEHTVTEQLTGVDLVEVQLRIARGEKLATLGVREAWASKPPGFALQVRVNMETVGPDGAPLPTSGTLAVFEPPSGFGVRVDTFGYAGYRTSTAYDSLLAKVIVRSRSTSFADVAALGYRALSEFRIEGLATNIPFLQSILRHPWLGTRAMTTTFVEQHVDELRASEEEHPKRYFETAAAGHPLSGARLDPSDPLAVLAYGSTLSAGMASVPAPVATETSVTIAAPLAGTVVSTSVAIGDLVASGQELVVMEAMKMEHLVAAPTSGTILAVTVDRGDTVAHGHPLVVLEPGVHAMVEAAGSIDPDLDEIRADLAEVLDRRALGRDEARSEAVSRRRAKGSRTTRENIDALIDRGSFREYGPLVIAAQRQRRSTDDLIRNTPADGVVAGLAQVNSTLFGQEASQCAIAAFDDTVLAGTIGLMGHEKLTRFFEVARQSHRSIVLLAEGGGGRAGDTDGNAVIHLEVGSYRALARCSGLVPIVGIANGRCFAGNAGLLGVCDVIIATRGSNIGMGGPAMVEGGGLGAYRPEEIGPMSVQVPNGVVDIAVEDEPEAIEVAKQYLGYFQGAVPAWEAADQRENRFLVPENRLRSYDVRKVIDAISDIGSVLEVRAGFGLGMVTALIRVEGRPLGVIANNPLYLGGAIDSDAADKAARFMQLCEAFELPILLLCDTPGVMVGPEAEKAATVRKSARMFVTGANLTVPIFTIVLRKAYGIGAELMAGGCFKAPTFVVSWPTGEFGGMGLEGEVKLSRRNELALIEDVGERRETFERMVTDLYQQGHAINVATYYEFDDVIDPAESRSWIVSGIGSHPAPSTRTAKKLSYVDTW